MLNVEGQANLHDVSANHINLAGTITGHDANLNDVSVNHLNLTGTITGHDAFLNDISLAGNITGQNAILNDMSLNGNAIISGTLDVSGDLTVEGSFLVGSVNHFSVENITGNTTTGNTLFIGQNDDSTTPKTIKFGGTISDNDYEYSIIENRVYGTTEKSELLLFKGNDTSTSSGPDRIRLRAGQIDFDTYSSATGDRTAENIRMSILSNGQVFINGIHTEDKDVFFHGSTSARIDLGSGSTLVWNQTVLGSAINSNGFIADRTGRYCITLNIFFGSSSSGGVRVGVKVNGSVYRSSGTYIISSDSANRDVNMFTGNMIVNVSAGQRITTYVVSGTLRYYGQHSYMSGFYVGTS